MVDWVDPEKVKKLGLDSPEWFETAKILDDPNKSKEEKDKAFQEYIDNFINSIKKEDYPYK